QGWVGPRESSAWPPVNGGPCTMGGGALSCELIRAAVRAGQPFQEILVILTEPTGATGAAIQRIAAFSDGATGGNPAGVWIGAQLPPEAEMQQLAYEVGFSETAFAAPLADGAGWRVRYFSPETEIPFCG